MFLIKIILNPLYRFITTIKIYASDHDVIWEAWDKRYSPFGYTVKKYPKKLENGWVMMVACKDLLKNEN